MSIETKMSIAVDEAERIWQPSPRYAAPYDRDARIEAYVRGRTADPCKEQIDAVADKLKELVTEESITAFFDTLGDWEDTMTDEQVEAAAAKHFARLVLEAAQKAVM